MGTLSPNPSNSYKDMTMEYFEEGVSLDKDVPCDLVSYPRGMPLTTGINNIANLCQIILWQTSSSEFFFMPHNN